MVCNFHSGLQATDVSLDARVTALEDGSTSPNRVYFFLSEWFKINVAFSFKIFIDIDHS